MADAETFHIHVDTEAAHAAAWLLFNELRARLVDILPAGAEIHHIGATAIPGCLTKGDLDILVRVPAAAFADADVALAKFLARNTGSIRTNDFSAFEDGARHPPLGVQLTTIGGGSDDFHRFAEVMNGSPELVAEYNALKRRFDGRAMDDYRAAKDCFIAAVLGKPPC